MSDVPDQPSSGRFSFLFSRWTVISISTLVYWLISQAVRPFMPIELQNLGASDPIIGLAIAGYAFSGLLLAIPAGRMLDRLPQHRVLLIASAGHTISTFCLLLANSVLTLSLVIFISGIFNMWVWLVLQSMITRLGKGRMSRQHLSLFSLVWGIGAAAGPSMGAFIYDHLGFSELCLVCTVVLAAGTVSVLAAPEVPPIELDPSETKISLRSSIGSSLQNPVLVAVLLSSFIAMFVLNMRVSFYPLYLGRIGIPLSTVGLLLSTIGVASLMVRLILPVVIERFGPLRTLTWSTAMTVVGAAVVPVSDSLWFLILAAVLVGLGSGANPPLTVNLIAEHSSASERGLAVGLRMVSNRGSQVSQPILFGAVTGLVGLAAAFPLSGVLLGVLTVWMAIQLRAVTNGSA